MSSEEDLRKAEAIQIGRPEKAGMLCRVPPGVELHSINLPAGRFELEGQPVRWQKKLPTNPKTDTPLGKSAPTDLTKHEYYFNHVRKEFCKQSFGTYQGICLGIIQPAGVGDDYECAQLLCLDTSTGKVHQVDTDLVTFINFTQ